ncbi:MAG: tryptophan--tRNA ligase, partial [Oscillospiraceae bacterium]
VTDSDNCIKYAPGKDGINNLITIYSSITGKTVAAIENEFQAKGYGDFKVAVGQTVADYLKPVRDEFARLMNDKAYLEQCYTNGAKIANKISQKTLAKVYKKVGFIKQPFLY